MKVIQVGEVSLSYAWVRRRGIMLQVRECLVFNKESIKSLKVNITLYNLMR